MTDQPKPAAVELPAFSGDMPPCIKCGFRGAYTEYRSPHGWTDYANPVMHVDCEHLHRTCQRCGYGWPEAIHTPPTATTEETETR